MSQVNDKHLSNKQSVKAKNSLQTMVDYLNWMNMNEFIQKQKFQTGNAITYSF